MARAYNGRARRRVACVVAIGLSLAACEDDRSDTQPTTTSVPASAPASTAVGTAPPTTIAADPELVFGYLAPGVGLLNALAIGQERGLTLAVAEINAAGGTLGAPVAAVRAEESADRPLTATVDDLVEQDADVIVGPAGSATAAELLPLLEERSLLACSASATATSLTKGGAASFVRTALRDDHFAAIVADVLVPADDEEPPPATTMIVARDDVYGNELTAALSAELTARGVDVSTLTYPPRRVSFPDESAAISAAAPARVVLASYTEAPNLVSQVVTAGYPVGQIVGLDGLLVPRLAEQTFPSDPTRADGLTVVGTTGDRALMARLGRVEASEDQLSYGPQMYDCAITLALAATAAGSTESAAVREQLPAVTTDGRTCSTFAHCVELLAAGEDIDYAGTTGPIAFDEVGDNSSARVTTASVVDGQLQPVATSDVDLVAQRQEEIFDSAVFVTQLQLALRALGFYDGDVTGVYDEATTAAVAALQRDLGLPDTGEFDEATDTALRERLGRGLDAFTTSVAELQQALAERGYYAGPIDGRYSAELIGAIKAFQRDLGVPQTGIIDVATLQAIYARGVATGTPSEPTVQPPPPTTATPPTPTPTTDTPAATTTAPATTTTASPPSTTTSAPTPDESNLYDVLSADPQFSTLVEVARAAGYGSDLAAPGPVTLFAPTNEAFATVDDNTLEQLRSDPAAADALLRDLAVEGALPSRELETGELRTIGGGSIEVTVDADTITVGGASVVERDIIAANGVAHALDALP
jgi:branched-chain amino acid transport system substrate-binding protein